MDRDVDNILAISTLGSYRRIISEDSARVVGNEEKKNNNSGAHAAGETTRNLVGWAGRSGSIVETIEELISKMLVRHTTRTHPSNVVTTAL